MTIKELRKQLKGLPDNMEVIVDNSPIGFIGVCAKSQLTNKYGSYLKVDSVDMCNFKKQDEIKEIEKYLSMLMLTGISRDEAKQKYMAKYIYPMSNKLGVEIRTDCFFYWDK